MCQAIAKYLLFAFNFIFWLAGAACLGVGIWLEVDESVKNSIEVSGVEEIYIGVYVLIAAGAIMLVVGFFGCCGAIRESQCLLGTYFIFLFILFGLEVGIGIYCLVEYDSVQEGLADVLKEVPLENGDSPLVATEKNLRCCGKSKGCQDWVDDVGNALPSYGCGCNPNDLNNASYCVSVDSYNPVCLPDPSSELANPNNYVYAQPCDQALANFISDNFVIVGAVALAIGLAEIIGMIIAMSLCCSIKNK